MFSLLLAVIYLTFISLGLPDGLLGAAWPIMHVELNAPVAAQSVITVIISGCTIVSSLLTARLVARLGTGKLCALSVTLTAIAILGFSQVQAFWQLCVLALPYGLGAGAIDAALNNYVALNYGQRHMSWLHCCWGIGASTGPLVMGWALSGAAGWSMGYVVVGAAQVAISIALFMTLPLWRGEASARENVEETTGSDEVSSEPPLSNRELLRLPGAWAAIGSFGTYCALENSTGLWIASYLVMARGVDAATAASIVSLFYLGITAGRFLSGVVASWLTSEQQIRVGFGLITVGVVLLVVPFGADVLWLAVGLMGLGCAPIYPSVVALTPRRFGERASQGLVSLQMACAYAGSSLMPPLFGLVAGAGYAGFIPMLIAVLLIADIILAELATARTR